MARRDGSGGRHSRIAATIRHRVVHQAVDVIVAVSLVGGACSRRIAALARRQLRDSPRRRERPPARASSAWIRANRAAAGPAARPERRR